MTTVDAAVLVDEEYVEYLTRLMKSADSTLREMAYAELLKVGPKGYEHGWIFVGAPGVGTLVHHPTHGHGKVVRAGKKTSEVQFTSGHKAAFEHSANGPSDMHFVSRTAANTSGKRPATPKAPEPAAGVKTPGASDEDRKIAEAESRVTVTRERLTRAQATFDRASRDPKADALAEHFPLGVGGSGGGRRGSADAQLRRYVEARQARDAAHSQHVRAEAQLKELTARRNAAGKYDRSTVSAGDAIKVDGTWWRVQKANDKTVQVDAGPGMDVKYRWDRVTDHRPKKVEAVPEVQAPAAPDVAAKPPKEESWQVSRRLHEATSKDQARAILQGRSMTELRDISDSYRRQHNYRSFGPRKTKKADLIEQLVGQSVGYKERTGQLRKPGSVFGRTGTEMPRVSQTDLPASLGKPDRPSDAHEFTMPAERSSRPVQAGDRVKHGTSTGKVLRLERKYGIDGAVVTTDGEMKYPNWMPLAQIHVKPTDDDAKKLAAEAAVVREQQARSAVEREAAQAAAAERTVRAVAARQALAGTPVLQLRSQGKKGDLAILETESSSFTLGRGHERQKQFELVRVAGTNRAGVPTAYHDFRWGDPKPGDQPIKVQPRHAYQHSFHVIPPGSVNEQGAIETARANPWHPGLPNEAHHAGKPFESLDEARVALAPHVTPTAVLESTGPIKAKPAGKDWEKVPSLIPRPRRGSGGLAPKAPAEVNYTEPTGLAPGAKVAWTHHHEDGTTSQRTGRVWDAAPGTNSAWVVPDERKPTDPYSAIVVKPEGRGGKLVSHDSTHHTTGSLAHAAAEQAHTHRYGPKPMPFTPASIEQHIEESASELGVPSGLTHQYGMTRSDNNTLEQLLRGFNRNTPAEHRTTPVEAAQRLRAAADLYNRNVAEADARSYGNLDTRYRNWQDMAKLYTKIADRIEADWDERVARARAQGSANKSAMGVAEFTRVLRTAELVWMFRTGQLLAKSA